MFSGCRNLTKAPALPATTLADFCYSAMFSNCINLKEAPALPATTLTYYCYSGMFSGCRALTDAPVLPAKTLADKCYLGMFHGCSRLNYLKVHFSSWTEADYATLNWVNNVSPDGTFVGPEGLNISIGDGSHIPEGWTVTLDEEISPEMNNSPATNEAVYNIFGLRVDEHDQGIIIQNGKKYLNK